MRGTKPRYNVGGPKDGKFFVADYIYLRRIGPFYETEDEAEAEADRLNADEMD